MASQTNYNKMLQNARKQVYIPPRGQYKDDDEKPPVTPPGGGSTSFETVANSALGGQYDGFSSAQRNKTQALAVNPYALSNGTVKRDSAQSGQKTAVPAVQYPRALPSPARSTAANSGYVTYDNIARGVLGDKYNAYSPQPLPMVQDARQGSIRAGENRTVGGNAMPGKMQALFKRVGIMPLPVPDTSGYRNPNLPAWAYPEKSKALSSSQQADKAHAYLPQWQRPYEKAAEIGLPDTEEERLIARAIKNMSSDNEATLETKEADEKLIAAYMQEHPTHRRGANTLSLAKRDIAEKLVSISVFRTRLKAEEEYEQLLQPVDHERNAMVNSAAAEKLGELPFFDADALRAQVDPEYKQKMINEAVERLGELPFMDAMTAEQRRAQIDPEYQREFKKNVAAELGELPFTDAEKLKMQADPEYKQAVKKDVERKVAQQLMATFPNAVTPEMRYAAADDETQLEVLNAMNEAIPDFNLKRRRYLANPDAWEFGKILNRTAAGADSITSKMVGAPIYAAEIVGQNISNLMTGENEGVNSNSLGTQQMRHSKEQAGIALSGLDGVSLFVGEAALSIGQNLANYAVMGPLGTVATGVSMGVQAGADAAFDIGERGGTAWQQLAGGTLSGVAEGIGEGISFGRLKKIIDAPIAKRTVFEFAKRIGAQMVTEFTEEAATEVMNIVIDAGVMQDKAELAQYFAGYMEANPGQEGTAILATAAETIRQVMYAGAQGAVSGGVMGGGATAIGFNDSARADKAFNSNANNNITGAINSAGQSVGAQTWAPNVGGYEQIGGRQPQENERKFPATARITTKLALSIESLQETAPVYQITGNEFAKGSKDLVTQVDEYYTSLGNKVTRPGFGDVILTRDGIRSSMAHGIGRAKAANFASVPAVIQNGTMIDYSQNWKGRGYDSYIFAAPVEMDGDKIFVAVNVLKNPNSNDFYLHEVVDGNGNLIKMQKKSTADSFKTGVTNEVGVTGEPAVPYTNNVAQGGWIVNNGAVDGNSNLIKTQKEGTTDLIKTGITGEAGINGESAVPYTNNVAQGGWIVNNNANGHGAQWAAQGSAQSRDTAAVAAAYKQAGVLRKEADRVARNVQLSDAENNYVKDLLSGMRDLSEPMPPAANVDGMRRLYEARKAEKDVMTPVIEYQATRRNAVMVTAENAVQNSGAWKDLKKGAKLENRTIERVFRAMVKNPQESQMLIDEYMVPIHWGEAHSNNYKNEMRDSVRALQLNKHESVFLQMHGELQGVESARGMGLYRTDAERNALATEASTYLAENSEKIDINKIDRAVPIFRAIYDTTFEMVNDVYVKNGYEPMDYRHGYWPHFSETASDDLLTKIGQALGIEAARDELPTDIAGLTHYFRPGRRWNPHAMERGGFVTEYDALQGMDKYLEIASDVIYHTENIRKVRALESAIREKHSNESTRAQLREVRENKEMSEDAKQAEVEKIGGNGHLSNFVQELTEYANLLAGKKSIHSRSGEKSHGRKSNKIAKNIQNRVAANMVAMNIGSALTNFIPITQAAAEVKQRYLVQAAWDTVNNNLRDDGFVRESSFLTNRKGSEPLSKERVAKISDKAGIAMKVVDSFTAGVVTRGKFLQNIENGMDRTSAIADADAYAAGLIGDRSKGALPTRFVRQDPANKLFTMFQVEVNNQWGYLLQDLPYAMREKGKGVLAFALLKYFVGAKLFNDLFEMLTGRRPALDIIGMINDGYGAFNGYKLPNTFEAAGALLSGNEVDFTAQKKSPGDAAVGVAKDVLEEIPFYGGLLGGGRLPINAALPDVFGVIAGQVNGWLGKTEPESARESIWNELKKPAYYLLPPFGGGQAKKFIEGIGTVLQGGSYALDKEGNQLQRFEVEDPNLGTYVQAGLFGPYALPSARDYVESGFDKKSAQYTASYKAAIGAGISGDMFRQWWELKDTIKADKNANGNPIPGSKRDKLIWEVDRLPLSIQQKMLLLRAAGVE